MHFRRRQKRHASSDAWRVDGSKLVAVSNLRLVDLGAHRRFFCSFLIMTDLRGRSPAVVLVVFILFRYVDYIFVGKVASSVGSYCFFFSFFDLFRMD